MASRVSTEEVRVVSSVQATTGALRSFVPVVLLATACSVPVPSQSQAAGSSGPDGHVADSSVGASASLRAFGEEDVSSLLMQDGDVPGVEATQDGRAGREEEPSDAEWTEHITDHGLQGRWWSGAAPGDANALGYAFVLGARVSLWADADAAVDALAFENSTGETRLSTDVPELGAGAACAVLDWGSLSDRAWCRFAVSNATFDVYIRTGDQTNPELDPRARRDLAALALLLRERAERQALEDRP